MNSTYCIASPISILYTRGKSDCNKPRRQPNMARTKGAHNEATPLVRDGKLYLPSSNRPVAYVGSQKWYSWLNGRTVANGHHTSDGTNYSTFYFEDGPLRMTCILQRRKSRNSEYSAWMGSAPLTESGRTST